ncbi:MAG: hypothetical protein ABIP51_20880, partial [Bacteroidia bacterium]
MAIQKPLVLINGECQEIPSTDNLSNVSWGFINGTITAQTDLTTYINSFGFLTTSLAASTYEPIITVSTSTKYWRGDKTFQTLNTLAVPELTNLYFTEARVRSTPLTGLSITGSSILAADTVLQAFGKLQNQINGVLGGAIYKGVYNATTNTPTLVDGTGTAGYYYVVNVGGNQNFGSGIINFNVGDWAIYNGAIWQKVDNTDAVSDVNGAIGSVVITTTGTANRISVSGGAGLTPTIDISSSYVGQTSLTTLGTIATGTWQGTAIAGAYLVNSGVTGQLITGYVSGSGVVAATDSILGAIQKLNGNIGALVTGVSSVNALTGAVALTGTASRITISAANVFDISASYDALWQPIDAELSAIAGLTSAA